MSECPIPGVRSSDNSSACPVGGAEGYNAAANDAIFSHTKPFPGQSKQMDTTRTVSNIPKGSMGKEEQPYHQALAAQSEPSSKWVYPSEQQYYNAMRRKGYTPAEEDIASTLAIHNVVNETSWREILKWELARGCDTPTLKRFVGRPKDFSPKAQFLNMVGGELPFDRHDWYVDRDGEEVRYVIDFYDTSGKMKRAGKAVAEGQVPVHVDVRPALDTPGAIAHRVLMTAKSITKYF